MPLRLARRTARGLGATLVLALSGGVGAQAVMPVATAGDQRVPGAVHVERFSARVLASNDNRRRPYIVIDKANATVFVFDAGGRLQGTAAALLGMARGDDAAAGIGARDLAAIDPRDRVTPAGRFHAYLDRDAQGKEVLLVDYEASIALHAVVPGTPAERRAERLASATADDNRITFGCINVPLAFYRDVVSPAFARTYGYVYILPESGEPEVLLP
jgi:hypothetical protein